MGLGRVMAKTTVAQKTDVPSQFLLRLSWCEFTVRPNSYSCQCYISMHQTKYFSRVPAYTPCLKLNPVDTPKPKI